MKTESFVRLWAGLLILASLALAHYHNPLWLWFTAFVGFMLFQSALTGFCPASWLYEKATGRGTSAAPATRV